MGACLKDEQKLENSQFDAVDYDRIEKKYEYLLHFSKYPSPTLVHRPGERISREFHWMR